MQLWRWPGQLFFGCIASGYHSQGPPTISYLGYQITKSILSGLYWVI